MRIPKSTIEAIRERSNIAELIGQSVALKRRGRNLLGLCPFHQEKTPSFNVLPGRQIYHCFGCGEGGDVFKFLMKTQGLSFIEAVRELAGPAGVTIEEKELTPDEYQRIRRRASLHEVCAEACDWFQANLLTRSEGAAARAYLADRGVSQEIIERCRLGFAPAGWSNLLDHLHQKGVSPDMAHRAGLAKRSDRGRGHYDVFRDRVIFPILDSRDRPIAFGGRLMEGDGPKYLNSPESDIYDKSSTLYGLSWARSAIQKNSRAIVVEGYFDVLSLLQEGIDETVATCGTSLTAAHARILRRFTGTVVALFDGDEAGIRAADKSLPIFLDAGLEARHLELPAGMDPDDFLKKEGLKAFQTRLERSTPLLELVVRRAAARCGSTPGGRSQAASEVAPLLRRLQGVLGADMVARTADLLRISERALIDLVGRTPNVRPSRGPQDDPAGPRVARWVGNKQLNLILWLLIHFPDQVMEPLSGIEPEIVTTRDDVKWVIAQLMSGTPLATVLAEADPDVAQVLQAAAAREGLQEREGAANAARQALAILELKVREARLLELHRQLKAADVETNWSEYRELVDEKRTLHTRIKSLKSRAARRDMRP